MQTLKPREMDIIGPYSVWPRQAFKPARGYRRAS